MTGAQLADRLEKEARRRGQSLQTFLRPISAEPDKWLAQLRIAIRPQTWTIARVNALIEDRPIPSSPRIGSNRCNTMRRADRPILGLPPSVREVREGRCLSNQLDARRETERRLTISRMAHDARRPGETIADCAARLAKEQQGSAHA